MLRLLFSCCVSYMWSLPLTVSKFGELQCHDFQGIYWLVTFQVLFFVCVCGWCVYACGSSNNFSTSCSKKILILKLWLSELFWRSRHIILNDIHLTWLVVVPLLISLLMQCLFFSTLCKHTPSYSTEYPHNITMFSFPTLAKAPWNCNSQGGSGFFLLITSLSLFLTHIHTLGAQFVLSHPLYPSLEVSDIRWSCGFPPFCLW